MKIMIKQEDLKLRNRQYGELRSTGALRQRVVRDRTKYNRKAKHKNRLTD